MAKYFRLPFAVNGDKKDVPDTTQTTEVSYNTGYSQDYQRNPESDPLARRVERNYFNDILFQVTDTLKELYETGVPPFITSAENDGKPFPYPLRARVRLNNRIYESTTSDNVTTPPASGWVLVDVVGLDDRYLNESDNLSDLPDKAVARTNLQLDQNYVQGAENLNNREVDNIDRFDLSGFYRADPSATGTFPSGINTGTLIVSTHAVTGDSTQVLIDSNQYNASNPSIHFRIKPSASEWGEWNLVTKAGDFGLGGIANKVIDLNIPLANRETLFNSYYESDAVNYPSKKGGVLLTITRGVSSGNHPAKSQTAFDSQGDVYTRVLSGGTYRDWKRVLLGSDNLKEITNPATARNNLGLGTAAVLNEGTEQNDLMAVGAFGLGSYIKSKDIDLNDISVTSFIYASSNSKNKPPSNANGYCLSYVLSNIYSMQMYVENTKNNRFYIRRNIDGWDPWIEYRSYDSYPGTINNLRFVRVSISFSSGVPVAIPKGAIGAYVSGLYRFGDSSLTLSQGINEIYRNSSSGGYNTLSRTIGSNVLFSPDSGNTLIATGGASLTLSYWIYAD